MVHLVIRDDEKKGRIFLISNVSLRHFEIQNGKWYFHMKIWYFHEPLLTWIANGPQINVGVVQISDLHVEMSIPIQNWYESQNFGMEGVLFLICFWLGLGLSLFYYFEEEMVLEVGYWGISLYFSLEHWLL